MHARRLEAGWTVGAARANRLVWACEACVAGGRALRARPWLQQFCCDLPRLAYFDVRKHCCSCGGDFVFGKAEQRRWYEEFKLTPSAEPVDCRACRAAKRFAAAANQELAEALGALDPVAPEQLVRVAGLYVALGRPQKASSYLRRAKNLSEDPLEIARLQEEIRKVEAGKPIDR